MPKKLILLAGVALSACSHLPQSPVDPNESKIRYTIQVLPDAQPPEVKIEMEFQSSASGRTKLILPAGVHDKKYFAGFDKFEADGAVRVESPKEDTYKILHHEPGAQLHIRYSLHQIESSDEPTIKAQYIYLFGSMFARPDLGDQPFHISIDWKVPSSWKIANSFGANHTHQEIDGVFNDNPIENIRYGVFVAGDFRLHKIQIHDHPVVFATRGHWLMADSKFVEVVKKIVTVQREMWGDFNVPYYFVLLLPKDVPCCMRGGYGMTHSFVARLSGEEYALTRFTHVLAHEHFHFWNGERLAPKEGSPEYWFTEGFTDYYARVLNLRGGLENYTDFVDDFNAAIYRYYESPDRLANDEKIEKDLTVLAYSRGNVYAAEWDLAIRKKTQNQKSLDHFMRRLMNDSRGQNPTLSKPIIQQTLAKFVGEEDAKGLMKMALDGSLLRPSDGALGPCAHVENLEIGKIEYGYDRNSPSRNVTKLVAGSAAAKAGLREGQEILEKREDWWKPWKQYEIRVKDNGVSRWIRYLPQSKERLTLPHFVVRGTVSATCSDWFKR